MINNRQNGRRRGRGGGGQRPGGGQGGQRDNGNRIDSRARGNANQLYEKYKNMAADAQRQGDRVNTEYYLQFADHYFRVLSDQRGRFEEQNQRRQQNDPFDDFDQGDDYGDEGEPVRADEQNQPRRDGRDGRDNRDGRDTREGRDDNRREQGRRDDYRRERDERPREQDQRNENRFERGNGDDRTQAEAPAMATEGEPAAEPRRRGRPRKVREEDGAAPAAFDADRLPPSLGVTSEPGNDDDAVEERPRRRRGRPAASEASQAG